MTASENARQARRSIDVAVTSTWDGVEHLVREEAITPGSAGCYIGVCGRSVRAAALACPPGPRCPDCTRARDAQAGSEQRRHSKDRSGWWAWLNRVRRARHRPARTTDGACDAH
ncbi:MAG: hypothetical protein ACRDS0_16500 [Pseudonocardiaceae bacterium]